MALRPFLEYCNDNPYGLTAGKLRYLIKNDPAAEKVLRRISVRNIFVDEDALEEWISSKKYFVVKRKRSPK